MGIYTSNNIFGIKIYVSNEDDNIYILFEKKYNAIMNNEQMREVYIFYKDNPQILYDNNIRFQVYTECSSTFDKEFTNYMGWYQMPLKQFLETFLLYEHM